MGSLSLDPLLWIRALKRNKTIQTAKYPLSNPSICLPEIRLPPLQQILRASLIRLSRP